MNDFSFSDLISTNTASNVENEDRISELNKENVDTSVTENLKPRSSRKSILAFLDPLNPYSSPRKDKISTIINEEDENVVNSPISKLDQSWNFMKLDTSATANDFSQIDINRTPTKNEDLLCSMGTPRDSQNISSDLKFLNLSEDENEVATDCLLSISPMKKYVDKPVHDKLKKYHKVKQEEWNNTEQMYKEQFENMKLEYEAQLARLSIERDEQISILEREKELTISALSIENEAKITEITKEMHSTISLLKNENEKKLSEITIDKESLIGESLKENEDYIEKLQSNHLKLMNSKQTEIDNLKQEIENLHEEVSYLNCVRIVDQCLIDQFNDSFEEIYCSFKNQIEQLDQDNQQMDSMLKKYLSRIDSSTGVIAAMKQNEDVLTSQVRHHQDKCRQIQMELSQKRAELEETIVNYNQEVATLKSNFQRQLKCREIRINELEMNESHLQIDLEMRTKERDFSKSKLSEIMEENWS